MTAKKLSLDAFIPYRLSFTSNLVSGSIAETYDALFALKIPEWRVIAWVAERDGISQQEICELTRMDKVTVSRAAIALTERGLFERKPNAADRRSHLLVLSEKGRALYAAISPKALELERRIFSAFSKEELDQFVGTLRRIDAIVVGLGEA